MQTGFVGCDFTKNVINKFSEVWELSSAKSNVCYHTKTVKKLVFIWKSHLLANFIILI